MSRAFGQDIATDHALVTAYQVGGGVDSVARDHGVTRGQVLAACRRALVQLRGKSHAQTLRRKREGGS